MAQDRPTIYKGQTIYKTGAAGGGGESWRDWYEKLEYVGTYDPNSFRFNNSSFLNIIKPDDIIHAKYRINFFDSIYLIYVYGEQSGNEGWAPKIELGTYTGYLDFKIGQPRNTSYRSFGSSIPIYDGKLLDIEVTRTDEKFSLVITDGQNTYNIELPLSCNYTASWRAYNEMYVYRCGLGSSPNPIVRFFGQEFYSKSDPENPKINFIPAKRKLDNVIGILETKTGLFSTANNYAKSFGPGGEPT